VQTYFGLIHMLTRDSNTLCTTDIAQRKLITVRVVWMVAAGFMLWTLSNEFMNMI